MWMLQVDGDLAHPRLRGDDQRRTWSRQGQRGSPPLTRGRCRPMKPDEYEPGLTPAYAGTILRTCRSTSSKRAHPRLRGDDRLSDSQTLLPMGSPPLTRGRFGDIDLSNAENRLTPAYAGTIFRWGRVSVRVRAHPRLRGDD